MKTSRQAVVNDRSAQLCDGLSVLWQGIGKALVFGRHLSPIDIWITTTLTRDPMGVVVTRTHLFQTSP